ncbi:MAG: hypothetical protein MJ095_06225 [Oscillospiraceae bacterium]|nr:hypothetical protein [Oscillospiraceae bacterium]
MAFNIMNAAAAALLAVPAPMIGDTRNMKTPVIVAVVAVVLIVGCLLLSGKSKDKK